MLRVFFYSDRAHGLVELKCSKYSQAIRFPETILQTIFIYLNYFELVRCLQKQSGREGYNTF